MSGTARESRRRRERERERERDRGLAERDRGLAPPLSRVSPWREGERERDIEREREREKDGRERGGGGERAPRTTNPHDPSKPAVFRYATCLDRPFEFDWLCLKLTEMLQTSTFGKSRNELVCSDRKGWWQVVDGWRRNMRKPVALTLSLDSLSTLSRLSLDTLWTLSLIALTLSLSRHFEG